MRKTDQASRVSGKEVVRTRVYLRIVVVGVKVITAALRGDAPRKAAARLGRFFGRLNRFELLASCALPIIDSMFWMSGGSDHLTLHVYHVCVSVHTLELRSVGKGVQRV